MPHNNHWDNGMSAELVESYGSRNSTRLPAYHRLDLGMTKEFNPRFLRRYMNLHDEMIDAISIFSNDIKSGNFPNENEQY